MYFIDGLLCPNCRIANQLKMVSQGIECANCKQNFKFVDGIFDLRTDPEYDTLLDQEKYDENHQINTGNSTALYQVYDSVLKSSVLDPLGDVLEIACGSGNLSTGIVANSSFSHFLLSDISPDFMKMAKTRIEKLDEFDPQKISYYLFDANNLPFVDNKFSAVVGNSVLHHFAHFENTIADCFRVLKQGGTAVFGEPILDTHSFVSLAAALILSIDSSSAKPQLSAKAIQTLNALKNRSEVKRANLNSDRSQLSSMEDKFQFPVEHMRSLAKKIGYSDFNCVTPTSIPNYGELIKKGISKVFKRQNIDIEQLREYEYVFDSISSTYGRAMEDELHALFGFFVFIK